MKLLKLNPEDIKAEPRDDGYEDSITHNTIQSRQSELKAVEVKYCKNDSITIDAKQCPAVKKTKPETKIQVSIPLEKLTEADKRA